MEEKKKYNLIGEDNILSDFPKIDLDYRESKDEVWSKIQLHLESKKTVSKRFLPFSFYAISVAASLFFLLGMITFFRYYTKTAICPTGQHLTITLPDHSEVILNAESIIVWHPYWMKFDRFVNFEGEAYFHVKKGSGFKVLSSKGETKVLGTTFNIYSREDYRVSCFTGSVNVASVSNKESVVLHPGDEGAIQKNGIIKISQLSNPEENKAWINGMFVFTGASLNSVINEVARQYNIIIRLKEDYPLTYTGNFSKTVPAEEVLNLICTSLELKLKSVSKGEYLIYKE